jgi:hypothetical protein
MSLDLGRFIRLRSAIDATIAASEKSHRGLVSATDTFRDQIRAMLAGEADLLAEFDGIFPKTATAPGSGSLLIPPSDPYGPAKLALAGMSGWLSGLIEAAQAADQQAQNARAYAETKVRSERGVGFRPE